MLCLEASEAMEPTTIKECRCCLNAIRPRTPRASDPEDTSRISRENSCCCVLLNAASAIILALIIRAFAFHLMRLAAADSRNGSGRSIEDGKEAQKRLRSSSSSSPTRSRLVNKRRSHASGRALNQLPCEGRGPREAQLLIFVRRSILHHWLHNMPTHSSGNILE